MKFTSTIRRKYQRVSRSLDEKSRRLWCASEALATKKGGVAKVHAATGVSRSTIYKGIRELESKRGRKGKRRRRKQTDGRIRKIGGGAKPKTNKLPTILQALEALVAPEAKGDPQSPLRWTNKGYWWRNMGKKEYRQATKLMITADCGGSSGNRLRLWKWELQKLGNETNLDIHVCHFPPGTSKWNKIEHRMFSYITQNWRGVPLISKETVVQLIGNTKTTTGLKIRAQIDYREYRTHVEVDDEDFETIAMMKNIFHGEWNYVISPVIAFEVEI